MEKRIEIMCSIIIPAYNSESVIERCLDSIESDKQGKYSIEVIVVDDGSKDNTSSVVDNFILTNHSVRLLRKENGGVSSARNLGLAQAKGKYIFFVDADDLLIRGTLDKMIDCAESNCAQLIVADYYSEDIHLSKRSYNSSEVKSGELLSREYIEKDIFNRLFIGQNTGLCNLWNKLFNKEIIFSNCLKFDENRTHGEDWAFIIRYLEKITNLFSINEPVYVYKLDGTQNYNKYRKGLSYCLVDGHKIMKRINDQYIKHGVESPEYARFMSIFAMQSLNFLSLHNCSKKEKKEFLSTREEKELWKYLLSLNSVQLKIAGFSRRDKIAFFLLLNRKYKLALKLLNIKEE